MADGEGRGADGSRERLAQWRTAFAETLLRWLGGVSPGDIERLLGLSHPTAQGIVNTVKGWYGGRLEKDSLRRRHRLRADEAGHLGHAIEATDTRGYLSAAFGARAAARYLNADIGDLCDGVVLEDLGELLSPPLFGHAAMAVVLASIRGRKPCRIHYTSKTRMRYLVISPHCVFRLGGRFFIRAWCHSDGACLHFAAGRIAEAEPAAGDYYPGGDADPDWAANVELRIRPAAALDRETADALALEWGIAGDDIRIHLRRCYQTIAVEWLLSQTILAKDADGRRVNRPRWDVVVVDR